MAQRARSVETTEVLDLAATAIVDAGKHGGTIAVDVEARRLLDAHPDCQIPFEELRNAIAKLATERGLCAGFGFTPDQHST